MLDIENFLVLENRDYVKSNLYIKVIGRNVRIGPGNQEFDLFGGDGVGYRNDQVIASRPNLHDGQDPILSCNNVDFRL